jgi:hypothetical protein
MSSVLANIVVGLVTSLLSGTAVWLGQRAARTRVWRRKAAFFGVDRGRSCLLILGRHHRDPKTMAHADIRALLEVATLVEELGGRLEVEAADAFLGTNGDRAEFCVGGPLGANARSTAHLAHHLPGLAFRPLDGGADPAAVVVGGRTFAREPGQWEYAVVARFTPPGASRPVFLICGQVPVANQAATHFLKREYRRLPADRFCVIVRIVAPGVYGHERVEREADVTAEAFAAPG